MSDATSNTSERDNLSWLIRAMREQCKCQQGFPEVCDWCQGATAITALQSRCEAAEREIRYLRTYGNKDCTAQADEARQRGELDTVIKEAGHE